MTSKKSPTEISTELTDLKDSNEQTGGSRRYDTGSSTRRRCLLALVAAAVTATAGIGFSAYCFSIGALLYSAGSEGIPAILIIVIFPLLLSLLVTFCNESLGQIHTITLRWALWYEGRLEFNTNLRLLSSASTSPPNTLIPNGILMLTMAISYAAASQIFIPTYPVTVNAIAIAALSASWLIQAILCTWALLQTRGKLLSWSPNPLNTTLACAQNSCVRNNFTRVPYRSMLPYRRLAAQDAITDAQPPLTVQQSMFKSRPSVRWTVLVLWIMFVASAVWAALFTALVQGPNDFEASATDLLQGGVSNGYTGWGPRDSNGEINGALGQVGSQLAISLAFVCAIQLAYLTFGLHCAELLVNVRRDEKSWRCAAGDTRGGAQPTQSAIKAAMSSWETLTLATFKTLLHWAFGQALVISFSADEQTGLMIYSRPLYILTGLTLLLALFGTLLAFQRPYGPQPAAHGHLRTLNDLIDDWGGPGEPLFWGDKGCLSNSSQTPLIRHAGTVSSKELAGKIEFKALYK